MKTWQRRQGNPYNFNRVHFNGPARGVEGMAAQILNLDPNFIPYVDIKIGGEYDVEYGPRDSIISFTPPVATTN